MAETAPILVLAGGPARVISQDPDDPGTPQAYRPDTPALLFGAAEEHLGPVDILVNNATGWLADTFDATTAEVIAYLASDSAALITANVITLR